MGFIKNSKMPNSQKNGKKSHFFWHFRILYENSSESLSFPLFKRASSHVRHHKASSVISLFFCEKSKSKIEMSMAPLPHRGPRPWCGNG